MGIAEFGSTFADHLALGQASREAARSTALGSNLNTVLDRARNSSLGLANKGTRFDVYLSYSADNGATWTAPVLLGYNDPSDPNAIPPGALLRLSILHNHLMVTGSFFAWLPGVENGNELPIAQSMVMRRE